MALQQTLHLIQRSPFTQSVLSDCLKVAGPNDSILLMQDGVYGLQHPELSNAAQGIYILLDDLLARGIEQHNDQNSNIQQVDYSGFINQCTRHKHVISWY